MTSSKCKNICTNMLPSCQYQQRTRHPKLKKFCIASYKTIPIFRGFEQLPYSSICWRVMVFNKKYLVLVFVGFEVLPNFCFLSHNFSSTYARKPIKCSKVSDGSVNLYISLLGLTLKYKQFFRHSYFYFIFKWWVRLSLCPRQLLPYLMTASQP